ncbi:pro-opiomelanocortin [Ornithorhynchus anatinus]|uniref:pro-opiomelanocortin n=1 Tax=Ornithorhynchus anatinus TaxID=9258 RepID=UPI0010A7E70C|nr:pro-opiomelanocortin [Ornithorhynchus anatinus]
MEPLQQPLQGPPNGGWGGCGRYRGEAGDPGVGGSDPVRSGGWAPVRTGAHEDGHKYDVFSAYRTTQPRVGDRHLWYTEVMKYASQFAPDNKSSQLSRGDVRPGSLPRIRQLVLCCALKRSIREIGFSQPLEAIKAPGAAASRRRRAAPTDGQSDRLATHALCQPVGAHRPHFGAAGSGRGKGVRNRGQLTPRVSELEVLLPLSPVPGLSLRGGPPPPAAILPPARSESRPRAADRKMPTPTPFGSCFGALLSAALSLALLHAPAGAHASCSENGRCKDLSSEANVVECLRACKLDLSAEAPVIPGNGHLEPLSENVRKYVMSHFRWDQFGRKNGSGGSVAGRLSGHKREERERGSLRDLLLPRPGAGAGIGGDPRAAPPSVPQPRDLPLTKRSYSMEHFRWGKPVGRKRRPVKVHPNGVEDESAEEFRRGLAGDVDYSEEAEPVLPREPGRELEQEAGDGERRWEEEEEEREEEDGEVRGEEEREEEAGDGEVYRMRHFRWGRPAKDKRYGGFMTSERGPMPLVTLFRNAIANSAHKKGQ